VVCVPFGGQDRYYLTTLPRAIFTPQDVAEPYRIRWEVELFFRGWRGAMSLDEGPYTPVMRVGPNEGLVPGIVFLSHSIPSPADPVTRPTR
jgi:hypothetical protein